MIRPLLLSLLLASPAFAQEPIRVLVWDEQQPEQKQAYGEKFLGETIAAHLATKERITVKSVALSSPDQGLSPALLDETDVLIIWSNKKNEELTDERAADIAQRVQDGKLSLIALHSAHWSKPFVKLMQVRSIADARKQLGPDVKFRYLNENPIGKPVEYKDPITPSMTQEDNDWVLTFPHCAIPITKDNGAKSQISALAPTHPIARGLRAPWDIPKTETQGEHFHVPNPDAVIFTEKWTDDISFRSGCVWNIGKGAVFYFRPGHETYPIYQQKEPLQVIENAIRWLHPAN